MQALLTSTVKKELYHPWSILLLLHLGMNLQTWVEIIHSDQMLEK